MDNAADSTGPVSPPALTAFFAAARLVLDESRAGLRIEEPTWNEFFRGAAAMIDEREVRRRVAERVSAGRFNVFRLINPDENTLSDILADLLDTHGTHGQGDRFLRLFLNRLALDTDAVLQSPARVVREAPTHTSVRARRLDIFIETGCAFVAIENKVDAADQREQVKDYLDHMRLASGGWAVPASLIYLTPNGREPKRASLTPADNREHKAAGRLRCWSYATDLVQWLDECRSACEADKIRHFLADFICYIDSDLRRRAVDPQSDTEP